MSAPEAVEQTLIIEAGAEARVAGLLRERGARKVLLLAMPHHRDGAERISAALGPLSAGIFDEVAQHVPVELAEKARARVRETGADWVVAHGGGTVIGFAKAIALTEDVQLCAIPTTYSGSERTGIWGLRGPEGKETGRDPRVRPALVVYDPELTVGLPQKLSLTSLMNAMAHALSALWRPSPGAAGEAEVDEAVGTLEALLEGFAAIAADPTDVAARAAALRGSARAGAFIERVPLGMQHLLAHVLGGTFGASHSDAHTAVLSYARASTAP